MTECCNNKDAIMDALQTLGKLCNCKVTETETGITLNIAPKDSSKVQEFKDAVKSAQESCGCSCSCG